MRQTAITAITLWALLWSAQGAFANDPDGDGGADVMTRARPEYDARGVRVGTFFLYPSLAGGFGYSSNVFNDSSNLTDYFYSISPQLKFQSAWARHALNLSAESKGFWYSNQVGENRTEWNLGADARIDIMRGSDIGAKAHFTLESEPRGTDLTGGLLADDPAEPTQLSRTGFGAEFNHTLNRVRISLGASLEQIDYDDTPRGRESRTHQQRRPRPDGRRPVRQGGDRSNRGHGRLRPRPHQRSRFRQPTSTMTD